jgi:hypothetical protein
VQDNDMVLIRMLDGLVDASGIFINTKKQQLLLCTKRDQMAVLYDVSMQPRDEDIYEKIIEIIRRVYAT